MDIPRVPRAARRQWLLPLLGLVIVLLVTVSVGRLKAAAPTLDRSALWLGTVKRGPMLRHVKGNGRLVPEQTQWITTETAGRVERISGRPGMAVQPDTPLMELTNADLMLQALQAEREVASAEADLLQMSSRLRTQQLKERGALATLVAERIDAEHRAHAYTNGAGEVFTELDVHRMQARATELTSRVEMAKEQIDVVAQSLRDEIAAQRNQIGRRREVAAFRKQQVAAMHVRAGGSGVLQEIPVELGQWVVPGTVLAKVVQPERLKAEIRVSEVQAKDLIVGQHAEVDTRNGIVAGHVAHIATAAHQGTVTVEIALDGDLPKGARPDLNVEGTIELERLNDVLFVERPAGSETDGPSTIFRMTAGQAERIRVVLGRSSVSTIEVREGLREGDEVVLSDMARWDSVDRVNVR
ncbi:HlyD family efflux transporter periplasmic adaptor subunit [Pendulispora rubella]|uniref:HlyD family efflux transporter periplasmic adaptor subunit n=1 Tax=Pendulispora rubella TaxID=2741070 RepID=A0ABZ2L106_9BACT